MSVLLLFLCICNIVEKIVFSIASFFISCFASISTINDDINNVRKLSKRNLKSILLCNLCYEGPTDMTLFVKKEIVVNLSFLE